MDQLDLASELEERARATAIKNATSKPSEIPDEDENGRYCLSCGHSISAKRLEAQPQAVRCIQCQQKREKNSGSR